MPAPLITRSFILTKEHASDAVRWYQMVVFWKEVYAGSGPMPAEALFAMLSGRPRSSGRMIVVFELAAWIRTL